MSDDPPDPIAFYRTCPTPELIAIRAALEQRLRAIAIVLAERTPDPPAA